MPFWKYQISSYLQRNYYRIRSLEILNVKGSNILGMLFLKRNINSLNKISLIKTYTSSEQPLVWCATVECVSMLIIICALSSHGAVKKQCSLNIRILQLLPITFLNITCKSTSVMVEFSKLFRESKSFWRFWELKSHLPNNFLWNKRRHEFKTEMFTCCQSAQTVHFAVHHISLSQWTKLTSSILIQA